MQVSFGDLDRDVEQRHKTEKIDNKTMEENNDRFKGLWIFRFLY